MVKLKKYLGLIIAALLFITGPLHAQDKLQKVLSASENLYADGQGRLAQKQALLRDMLQTIDRLKRDKADKLHIEQQMAQAHSLSRQIDAVNDTLNIQSEKIRKIRAQLYAMYSLKADSLSGVLKNNPANDLAKQRYKEVIFMRNRVSPVLPLFSFNPQLISKIDSVHSKTEPQKSIYLEYLQSALTEVDSNIAILKSKKEALEVLIALDEQAEEFIDDLDGDSFFSSSALVVNEISITEGKSDAELFSTLSTNIQTIYPQISPDMDRRIELPPLTQFDSLATNDYVKLLHDTEETLRLYRDVILKKIDKN